MPWFNRPEQHTPAPGKATLWQVWESLRVLRTHHAGVTNTLSTIVLVVTRLDTRVEGLAARVEGLAADVALLHGQLAEDEKETPDEP
jgi:hypothetical protein